MAVAITQIGGPFGSIIVRDTDCNNSATTIASPTTGSIIQIAIDNPNTTAVYYKMADTGSPVVGTTAADLVVRARAASVAGQHVRTTVQFGFQEMPFSTGFSSWCVTTAAEAGNTSPALKVSASYTIGG
tara:strand:+ start:862 stop:1248 length:387 start_codon:yes stop_codon:yes gene_type:complete